MQTGQFLSLVKNVTALDSEELVAARELAGRYPYSQLLHLIVARGARDQKAADEQAVLHRAAVYATDRGVLKSVITLPRQPRVEIPVQVEQAKPGAREVSKETIQPVEAPRPAVVEVAPRTTGTSLEGDALRADLKAELNRLHHLMSAFDATYEQLKKGGAVGSQAKVITDDMAGDKKLADASKKVAPVRDSGEAPLIEEIKSSKRKPKLVSPKVAEQGEIIDQFIKVAPTLPRTQPTEPTTDLSEESVNYGDNIVSETLVEILLKQGKKAKAIEMLKKLIWKFPQKKAYFAAQIDALKG